jgi:chitinase
MPIRKFFLSTIIFYLLSFPVMAQQKNFSVIAYYSGNSADLDKYKVEELTHIIYCFTHLKGNKLNVGGSAATETIKKMVGLKKRNPDLKVILSLGGWGGCATCSDVFSSASNRKEFAESVKAAAKKYHIDGIDLDWEYPAILGYPSHAFKPSDRENFTDLIVQLRNILGKKFEISFAAGGFKSYIDSSVDWQKVMPLVDRVNLMSYDLVNGYDSTTGHHTALYSTGQQQRSTDEGVKLLLNAGVPKNKIVIGAAFYARVWENVPPENNGLYQTGKFKKSVAFKNFENISEEEGFTSFWDDEAKAPYSYNPKEKLFATYDDKRSVELKAKYVVDNGLDGIMFWELSLDTYQDGLLESIYRVKVPAH